MTVGGLLETVTVTPRQSAISDTQGSPKSITALQKNTDDRSLLAVTPYVVDVCTQSLRDSFLIRNTDDKLNSNYVLQFLITIFQDANIRTREDRCKEGQIA